MPHTADQIRFLWGAGRVNRWHAHPDPRLRNSGDTVAAHGARVATLVAALFPTVAVLEHVLSALWHDAAEAVVGDVPYPARHLPSGVRSTLGREIDDIERRVLRDAGVSWVECGPLVRLCDRLDAWMFVHAVAPDLLDSREWQAEARAILSAADDLGVRAHVEELLW